MEQLEREILAGLGIGDPYRDLIPGSKQARRTRDDDNGYAVPLEPWLRLFLRFLRFGALAWGGPVAQIAMIRQELVDEERWINSAHFNRVLAVYQVLPGPEAHELCVYFGMRSRGRWGGVLAGLGFMLPGFLLMFALSWAYLRYGLHTQGAHDSVRGGAGRGRRVDRARGGAHRPTRRHRSLAVGHRHRRNRSATGRHPLRDHPGLGRRDLHAGEAAVPNPGMALAALATAGVAGYAVAMGGLTGFAVLSGGTTDIEPVRQGNLPTLALFWSGLKAGLLTFGGAYTVIPFLQHDAVRQGAWMSNAQFLDGLALSGLLPAPLIIFSTFVGYLGGGPWGALAMTAGIFLPAFAFTLVGHDTLERLVHQPRIRLFLEGFTAGVVGLIAGTDAGLAQGQPGRAGRRSSSSRWR